MNKKQYDDLRDEIQVIKSYTSIVDIVSGWVRLKKEGNKVFKGLCPFHDERTPSFVIFEDSQRYKCFGCGVTGDVVDFLQKKNNSPIKGVVDMLRERFVRPAKAHNMPPKNIIKEPEADYLYVKNYDKVPEFDMHRIYSREKKDFTKFITKEIYEYRYADGQLHGLVLVKRDSKGNKQLLPVSLYEHEERGLVWAFKGMGSPRPLYNMEDLIKYPEKPVLVVEGEKCAEAAKKVLKDFVVTTWSGGTSAIDQTDWTLIEKREVFIWPDNDPTGKKAAEKLAKDLHYAELVQIGIDKPLGWDIADAIQQGYNEEILNKIILSFRIPRQKFEVKEIEFDMPPGLLGELTKYILSASTVELPLLAVGAAIAVLATLQAQKVVTEDYIHPNIYILSLATSGVGKSFPLKVSKAILTSIGCSKLIKGTPTSGAAIINALHHTQGRGYFPIDEFGEIMDQLTQKNAASYQRDIIAKLLKLYTDSQSEYIVEEYSDRDKPRETKIIRKPNLILYSTTVPDNFYEAVHAGTSVNGFLARLLVLSATDSTGYRKDADEVARDLPDNLREVLLAWSYDPTNILGFDDNVYDFAPQVIKYENQARKLLREFGDESIKEAQEAEGKGDLFKSSLYRRNFEKASKLSLLARASNEYVDVTAVKWAIKLTKETTENFYKEAKNYIHKNEFEKNLKAIENYLRKKANWVTKAELANIFLFPPRQLKDLLDCLKDAKRIDDKFSTKKSTTNPTHLFKYVVKQ